MYDIGFYQSLGGREINEDTLFHLRLSLDGFDAHLLGVADGMGGMSAGEIASQQAVETVQNVLVKWLTENPPPSSEQLQALVRWAIEEANGTILARANGSKMGSTMTCAVVIDRMVVLGHIGDSRAYILSGTRLTQATEDHAVGNALTKRLGKTRTVSPDVLSLTLGKDETLILCTDGLHGPLSDEELSMEFNRAGPAKTGCIQAVQLALRKGGPRCDNISVVAFRNGYPPEPEVAGQRRVIQRGESATTAPPASGRVMTARSPAPAKKSTSEARDKERLLTMTVVGLCFLLIILAGVGLFVLSDDAQTVPAEVSVSQPPVQEDTALASAQVREKVQQPAVDAQQTKPSDGVEMQPEEDDDFFSWLLGAGFFLLVTVGLSYWLLFIRHAPVKNRYHR